VSKLDDEWVLLLDAYDTVLHPQFDAVLAECISKLELDPQTQMLISAEKIGDWCGPNCLELIMNRGWFANFGVILAKPPAIKQLLGAFLLSPMLDDQYFINSYINKESPSWIRIDTDRILCHTVVTWSDHGSVTHQRSAVFHFPGPWADMGWSRKYNSIVGEWASADLVPRLSLGPRSVIQKVLRTEHKLIVFVFQIGILWLSMSYLVLQRFDNRILLSVFPILYYVLHTYQTFT